MVNIKPIDVSKSVPGDDDGQDNVGERTPDMIRTRFRRHFMSARNPVFHRMQPMRLSEWSAIQDARNSYASAAGAVSASNLDDPFVTQVAPEGNHSRVFWEEDSSHNQPLLVAEDGERPVKRRRKANVKPSLQLRRYSPRTQSKPATSMDRVWHLLPSDIRERIWKIALEDPMEMRRIVYIRNRNTPLFPGYAQAPSSISINFTVPMGSSISLSCSEARAVFMRKFFEIYPHLYQSMFSRFKTHLGSLERIGIENTLSQVSHSSDTPASENASSLTEAEFWARRYSLTQNIVPFAPRSDLKSKLKARVPHPLESVIDHLDTSEQQPVNPDVDIIYIEPCCDGCRGHHCISRQFLSIDRNAIRFLVVKDEPIWPPIRGNIPACWQTLTKVFPNVETMYIDINNPGPPHSTIGGIKQRRVMVRVKPRAHPKMLIHRNRFAAWKKGDGKNFKLATIEFVAVHEHRKPDHNKRDGEQYPHALREGRRQKLADDVFIVR